MSLSDNTTLVALGPKSMLHRGVHSSLVAFPPAGVTYRLKPMDHLFVLPPGLQPSASPFLNLHWFESVTVCGRVKIVHSARLPVLNSPAWIIDTDDVFVPTLLGRAYLVCLDGVVKVRDSLPADGWFHVARRCTNMLSAYGHNSCLGILCRTDRIRNETLAWIAALRIGPLADLVAAKLQVMYPAQRTISPEQLMRKWQDSETLRVLFCCGRDYRRKNGDMALRIFNRLALKRPAVRFTYVGPAPDFETFKHGSDSEQVRVLNNLSRTQVQDLMAESHIFFHPSRFETLGTVLVEAAAAGMAIVVAKGLGSIQELVGESGAAFIDRGCFANAEEEGAFENCLLTLLIDRERAKSMGIRNQRAMSSPPWSIGHRDTVLQALYGKGDSRSRRRGLRLRDLPQGLDGVTRVISDADLRCEEAGWRRSLCLPESINLQVDVPSKCAVRGCGLGSVG